MHKFKTSTQTEKPGEITHKLNPFPPKNNILKLVEQTSLPFISLLRRNSENADFQSLKKNDRLVQFPIGTFQTWGSQLYYLISTKNLSNQFL